MKNSLLIYVFFLIILQSSHAQEWPSLLDSINKYKEFNPSKALQFGFQALEKANFYEISYDLYEINFKIGEVYQLNQEWENSFKYLSRSLAIYDLLPINKRKYKFVKKPPWVLIVLGNVYYHNGRYERAKKVYNEAIINFNLVEEDEQEKNYGLNTSFDRLGSLSMKEYDFGQAEIYFKSSLENRINFGRVSYIIYSYSLLIDLYFKSNKIELGLEYLKLAKKLFEKNKTNVKSETALYYYKTISKHASYLRSEGEILKALELYYKAKSIILNYSELHLQDVNFSIAECLYDLKKYKQTKEMIFESLNSNFYNVDFKINNYELLLKTYSAQKSFKDLFSINDSLKYYLLEKRKFSVDFSDIETQLIISEKQKELNLNKMKYNKYQYLFIIFILSILAVVIILFYNYNYQKEKNSRLDLEKKQIMIQLDSKNIELVSKANFIMQRNEFLINLKSKVDKISPDKVKKEISSVINAEKSYEEFDKIFTQVYPGFYENLKSKHDLSQTYLRLVAYIKMNENNNEIATLSGVSLRTVETQRYRLSKILELKDDQDLNSYIKNI